MVRHLRDWFTGGNVTVRILVVVLITYCAMVGMKNPAAMSLETLLDLVRNGSGQAVVAMGVPPAPSSLVTDTVSGKYWYRSLARYVVTLVIVNAGVPTLRLFAIVTLEMERNIGTRIMPVFSVSASNSLAPVMGSPWENPRSALTNASRTSASEVNRSMPLKNPSG